MNEQIKKLQDTLNARVKDLCEMSEGDLTSFPAQATYKVELNGTTYGVKLEINVEEL